MRLTSLHATDRKTATCSPALPFWSTVFMPHGLRGELEGPKGCESLVAPSQHDVMGDAREAYFISIPTPSRLNQANATIRSSCRSMMCSCRKRRCPPSGLTQCRWMCALLQVRHGCAQRGLVSFEYT